MEEENKKEDTTYTKDLVLVNMHPKNKLEKPLKLSKRKESFTGSKAGAIKMYRDPDDYDYQLLSVKTKALCSTKDRNLSNALKYHKPDPMKAGSLEFDKAKENFN